MGHALLCEEPERAVRLWGAAETLRAISDKRLALAMAQAQLGPEAFAAAWEAARTLTLEQAHAEALATS